MPSLHCSQWLFQVHICLTPLDGPKIKSRLLKKVCQLLPDQPCISNHLEVDFRLDFCDALRTQSRLLSLASFSTPKSLIQLCELLTDLRNLRTCLYLRALAGCPRCSLFLRLAHPPTLQLLPDHLVFSYSPPLWSIPRPQKLGWGFSAACSYPSYGIYPILYNLL